MKTLRTLIALIIVASVILLLPLRVGADTRSPGCLMLDGVTSPVGHRTTDFTFSATNMSLGGGERLTIEVTTTTGWIYKMFIESPLGTLVGGPVYLSSDVGATGTVSTTIPSDGIYDLYFQFDIDETDGAAFTYKLRCAAAQPQGSGRLFHDGRLNPMDPHAPVVFYPVKDGVHVYGANGSGLILALDAAFLADMPDNAVQNRLLWKSTDSLIQLWRLASGGYQFMVGPDANGDVYAKVFDALPPTELLRNASYNIYGRSSRW